LSTAYALRASLHNAAAPQQIIAVGAVSARKHNLVTPLADQVLRHL
jgi:hypothetical protein